MARRAFISLLLALGLSLFGLACQGKLSTVDPTATHTPDYEATALALLPTDTPTATLTPSLTPTNTDTPTATFTPSITPTATLDFTATAAQQATLIAQGIEATLTAQPTATHTATATATDTPTATATDTPTATATITPTATITLTPTATTDPREDAQQRATQSAAERATQQSIIQQAVTATFAALPTATLEPTDDSIASAQVYAYQTAQAHDAQENAIQQAVAATLAALPTDTPAPTPEPTDDATATTQALHNAIQQAVAATLAALPTDTPAPTATPEPTDDATATTQALHNAIQQAVAATLAALPTDTPAPSTTPEPTDDSIAEAQIHAYQTAQAQDAQEHAIQQAVAATLAALPTTTPQPTSTGTVTVAPTVYSTYTPYPTYTLYPTITATPFNTATAWALSQMQATEIAGFVAGTLTALPSTTPYPTSTPSLTHTPNMVGATETQIGNSNATSAHIAAQTATITPSLTPSQTPTVTHTPNPVYATETQMVASRITATYASAQTATVSAGLHMTSTAFVVAQTATLSTGLDMTSTAFVVALDATGTHTADASETAAAQFSTTTPTPPTGANPFVMTATQLMLDIHNTATAQVFVTPTASRTPGPTSSPRPTMTWTPSATFTPTQDFGATATAVVAAAAQTPADVLGLTFETPDGWTSTTSDTTIFLTDGTAQIFVYRFGTQAPNWGITGTETTLEAAATAVAEYINGTVAPFDLENTALIVRTTDQAQGAVYLIQIEAGWIIVSTTAPADSTYAADVFEPFIASFSVTETQPIPPTATALPTTTPTPFQPATVEPTEAPIVLVPYDNEMLLFTIDVPQGWFELQPEEFTGMDGLNAVIFFQSEADYQQYDADNDTFEAPILLMLQMDLNVLGTPDIYSSPEDFLLQFGDISADGDVTTFNTAQYPAARVEYSNSETDGPVVMYALDLREDRWAMVALVLPSAFDAQVGRLDEIVVQPAVRSLMLREEAPVPTDTPSPVPTLTLAPIPTAAATEIALEPFASPKTGLRFDRPSGWTPSEIDAEEIFGAGVRGIVIYSNPADIERDLDNPDAPVIMVLRLDDTAFVAYDTTTLDDLLVNAFGLPADSIQPYDNGYVRSLVENLTSDVSVAFYAVEIAPGDRVVAALATPNSAELAGLDEIIMQPLVRSLSLIDSPIPTATPSAIPMITYESAELALQFDVPQGWESLYLEGDDSLGEGTRTVAFYIEAATVTEGNFINATEPVLMVARIDGFVFENGVYDTLEAFATDSLELPDVTPYNTELYPGLRGTVEEDDGDLSALAYSLEVGERDWIVAFVIYPPDSNQPQLDELVLQPLVHSLMVLDTIPAPYESAELALQFDVPQGWETVTMTDEDLFGPGSASVDFYSGDPDGVLLMITRYDGNTYREGEYTTLDEFTFDRRISSTFEPYTLGDYPTMRGTSLIGNTWKLTYIVELADRDWVEVSITSAGGADQDQMDQEVLQPLVLSIAVIDTPSAPTSALTPYESAELNLSFDVPPGWEPLVLTEDDALGSGTAAIVFYSNPIEMDAGLFAEPEDPALLIMQFDGEVYEDGRYTSLDDFARNGLEIEESEATTVGSYPALYAEPVEAGETVSMVYVIELADYRWLMIALVPGPDGDFAALNEQVLQPLLNSLIVP